MDEGGEECVGGGGVSSISTSRKVVCLYKCVLNLPSSLVTLYCRSESLYLKGTRRRRLHGDSVHDSSSTVEAPKVICLSPN